MMRQNISTLIERDRTLGEIGTMAENLKLNSANFASKAKKLNFAMWLRTYGVCIGVILFIVFGLWYQFW